MKKAPSARTSASLWTVVAAAVLLPIVLITSARALEGTAPSTDQLDEIIVTAEKQEQSASTVGMPIVAVTAEVLQERGITSVADLTRLVAGLTLQQSSFNSTSFTLRGVGFFNSDLATPPAVTIYVDEVPLPYPKAHSLDRMLPVAPSTTSRQNPPMPLRQASMRPTDASISYRSEGSSAVQSMTSSSYESLCKVSTATLGKKALPVLVIGWARCESCKGAPPLNGNRTRGSYPD
jgi:hypothetical protein